MKISSLSLSLSLLPLTLVVGCMNRDAAVTSDTAEQSIDSQESVESEGNMLMGALDGADVQALTAATADQIAVRIAANIEARWAPSTCVSATPSGANVHVVYTDCTGPRRLAHVTGEVDLAVTASLTSIDVHATSASLQVNNADLAIDATAVYTRTGDERQVVVHSTGSGTGPRGNAIEHQGDYTITWNPTTTCGTVAGHWQTDLSGARGSAERSNDVDLERCAMGCPTGTIAHHFLNGAAMTITFDGTPTAQWSTSLGGSGSVTLQCQ
ncbi:MAG: hypothetical protein NT062_15130 [Proteobacteria bacterium]|nr:hypothetical protein [Pseudomonadota bacterium]